MLLQSSQAMPKTSDPLEMAVKNGKKIIDANGLLELTKKYLGKDNKIACTSSRRSSVNETNSRRLQTPYIKVVDNSFKYKTNFKELTEWPEINFEFQPELCPFYKPRKHNHNISTTNNTISQQFNKSGAIIGTKTNINDKFQTVLTTPILTNTPTFLTTNGAGNTNCSNMHKSIQTKNTSKKKHTTYCEICHKEYDDFEKVFIIKLNLCSIY